MKTTEPPELGLTAEQIDELHQLASAKATMSPYVDLAEGKKQILFVTGHSLIASNFVESDTTGKIGSDTVLLLRGKASPSSNPLLHQAYIRFVEDGAKLGRPNYSAEKGTIRLYMPMRALPVVLAQLHEPNVYCWIGHFAGGHIWGDIHTNH